MIFLWPFMLWLLLLLVAASVVAAVGLSGAAAVDEWTEDTARVELGAPQRITMSVGALQALQLTEELDPAGPVVGGAAHSRGEDTNGAFRADRAWRPAGAGGGDR